MIKRNYYSVRTGKISDTKITLEVLKKMFLLSYNRMVAEGYFQEHFGIDCMDGFRSGQLGDDIDVVMFVNLRKENLYPITKNLPNYSEDDLFDVLEFLYDHCSEGLEGNYHSWNNCGYHYEKFSDVQGKKHFREQLNPILKEYNDGYEISESGEIFILTDNGLSTLLEADIPTNDNDNDNITLKIQKAILKFRRHKSSLDERREAIRELADVLEYLRPAIKEHFDKMLK